MLVCEQHPHRWSSGEVRCRACSREESKLQRLAEKVSFLVCSADLGESNMSCLDLLLKIFVLDVKMLAHFVTLVACAILRHPLLSMPKAMVPMRSTCFPSMISRCGLSSILFCRPDQCSLTISYVDDNSCLISE
jgi:hypothetical protein